MIDLVDSEMSLTGSSRPSVSLDLALERELETLAKLDIHGLRRRWRLEMRRAPPTDMPKFLLLRFLAYRLQAAALGDIDPETRRILDRLGRSKKDGAGDSTHRPVRSRRRLKPGTVVAREWNGHLHRVTVLSEGFSWDGKIYESLSTIARTITGTQWSGPRFFGLLRKERTGTQDHVASMEGGV